MREHEKQVPKPGGDFKLHTSWALLGFPINSFGPRLRQLRSLKLDWEKLCCAALTSNPTLTPIPDVCSSTASLHLSLNRAASRKPTRLGALESFAADEDLVSENCARPA